MKLFILIFTTLFIFKANAQPKCYIINESKIEFRTYPVNGALNEPCPINDSGLRIEEITYQKLKPLACLDQDDCRDKAKNHCKEIIDAVEQVIGRLIINQDFTEIYCTNPVFSQSKRDALEAQKADLELQLKNKRDAKNQAKVEMIALKADLPTMTLPEIKVIIEKIVILLED